MVSFYKPQKKIDKVKAFEVKCQDIDLQGRGVCKDEKNKTWFVEGIMTGEVARVQVKNKNDKVQTASITKIIKESDKRKKCDCPVLDTCGGCKLEYIPTDMVIEAKVKGIQKLFKKLCNYDLGEVSFIAKSNDIAYRRACRLSTRNDHKKIILGFRSEKSHDLVTFDSCKVLTSRINDAIESVRKLINSLACKKKLGHVEFLDSDGSLGILIRVGERVLDKDREIIKNFGLENDFTISIAQTLEHEIDGSTYIKEEVLCNEEKLFINVDDNCIRCLPSSFVQINKEVNDALVSFVVKESLVNKESTVLDMFCGLGNFTLAFAKRAKHVVGVDIVTSMIDISIENAKRNNLDNVQFVNTDLEDTFENQIFAKQKYDIVVMDPGRSGAKRATHFLTQMKPEKIVLISCNPNAGARDIVELLKVGYKIDKWALFDMFPRTTHEETVILLSKV